MLFSHKLAPKKAKQLDFLSLRLEGEEPLKYHCVCPPPCVRKSLIKTENQNCQCKAEI